MRVLLIANYKKGVGGISAQVDSLYKNLKEGGLQVEIFSTKSSFPYKMILFVKLLLKGNKFHIFHIHACSDWGFLPAVIGILIGKLLKKKIILTYHGGGANLFFAKHLILVRYFLSKTDANIVLSGFLAKVFDYYKIPYEIVPNILELDHKRFKSRSIIQPRFISVRTLAPIYNIGCIIRAFEIVQRYLPESELYIVGDGPEKEKLQQIVSVNNMHHIYFTGRVSNQDIYCYLDRADILLSSPIIDNQPVSVLEAFNAGLLVISSNVGGMPYMIEDGNSGLLFESDNHIELADKILWALNNQSETLRIIHEAKSRLAYYSWDNIRKDIFRIYHL